ITFAVLGGVGWVENVTLRGITLMGDIGNGKAPMLMWAHRGRNLVVDDCAVIGANVGNHNLDLQGCDNVLVTRCRFLGFNSASLEKHETIQIDISSRKGAGSTAPYQWDEVFDGTPCRNIYIVNNVFDGYQGY